MANEDKARRLMLLWREDWNRFVRDVLKARLDREQQAIIESVQHNKMTAVASGTSRGKDFVSACAAMCFMYLTPRFNSEGKLVKNTKIAMTAPTARQVTDIMIPEISRLYRNAEVLPGRLLSGGIRTDYEEWYLTGFKSSSDNTEAWSGFHAVNTMFIVTEASGIPEVTYNAIEGNLQGNSRLLLVFNPNISTGYAARAMGSPRFKTFRLNSLNAENVVKKKMVIPGQVDYEWVDDKVRTWCSPIPADDYNAGDGDFEWEGAYYRPNDLFRVKVLGLFPKVSSDTLIPYEWVVLANERWRAAQEDGRDSDDEMTLGVDVAGMGRDNSVFVDRRGWLVKSIETVNSGGKADHMATAGNVKHRLDTYGGRALIDTIGEGAGTYSRLRELGYENAISCKFSENANGLHDNTGQYTFANMRAYLYWCIRDWLDPKNNTGAALPPNDDLAEELSSIKYQFQSSGSIIIESKDEIKKKIHRSPDKADGLANTFYPTSRGADTTLCKPAMVEALFTNDVQEVGGRSISAAIGDIHQEAVIVTWVGNVATISHVGAIGSGMITLLTTIQATKTSKSLVVTDGNVVGTTDYQGWGNANDRTFQNVRAECYYKLADMVSQKAIRINCDDTIKERLRQEFRVLCNTTSTSDTRKRDVTSREKMIELLGHTPDVLEALMMAMFFRRTKPTAGASVAVQIRKTE